jgi:hypothetical protein
MYLLGVRLFGHGVCEITSPKHIINQTTLDSSRSKLPVDTDTDFVYSGAISFASKESTGVLVY